MNPPTTVTDTNGARHKVGRLLGEGGQGAVYEIEGGRCAVKILSSRASSNTWSLSNQLHFLRQLSLDGIPIAKPIAVLKLPDVGYIMNLLSGMEPISELITPAKSCISLRDWYLKTGGLKRRLRICAKAADAIASLNARGLCYGDVSAANIFLSKSLASEEVCLIDADNLRFESTATNQPIYTPGFGAPEIVTGQGVNTTLSDAHAIAVLAFKTLSIVHPLIGDSVENGDPEIEEKAFAGQLPWIDHPTDNSNRSSRGLSRETTLSPGLKKLAETTFNEGLQSVIQRPTSRQWADAIDLASRNCVLCSGCKNSFYVNLKNCPWCGIEVSKFIAVSFITWDPEMNQGRGDFLRNTNKKPSVTFKFYLSESEKFIITERMALGYPAEAGMGAILTIEMKNGDLLFTRNQDACDIQVGSPKNWSMRNNLSFTMKIDDSLKEKQIRFGTDDKRVYRIMICQLEGGLRK